MMLLNAFLFGGALCLVFEALKDIPKLPFPALMLFGIILGSLLAAFGIMPALTQFGGGGAVVMILGLGELAYNVGALASAGMWTAGLSLLMNFVCIILGVFLIGILTALAYLGTHKQTQADKKTT
jgi:predicted outer membrane lipoprotein